MVPVLFSCAAGFLCSMLTYLAGEPVFSAAFFLGGLICLLAPAVWLLQIPDGIGTLGLLLRIAVWALSVLMPAYRVAFFLIDVSFSMVVLDVSAVPGWVSTAHIQWHNSLPLVPIPAACTLCLMCIDLAGFFELSFGFMRLPFRVLSGLRLISQSVAGALGCLAALARLHHETSPSRSRVA